MTSTEVEEAFAFMDGLLSELDQSSFVHIMLSIK